MREWIRDFFYSSGRVYLPTFREYRSEREIGGWPVPLTERSCRVPRRGDAKQLARPHLKQPFIVQSVNEAPSEAQDETITTDLLGSRLRLRELRVGLTLSEDV